MKPGLTEKEQKTLALCEEYIVTGRGNETLECYWEHYPECPVGESVTAYEVKAILLSK